MTIAITPDDEAIFALLASPEVPLIGGIPELHTTQNAVQAFLIIQEPRAARLNVVLNYYSPIR